MCVGDDELRAPDAPLPEVPQKAQPGPVALGVDHVEAHDVAVAVGVAGDGRDDRGGGDVRPVAAPRVGRVEPQGSPKARPLRSSTTASSERHMRLTWSFVSLWTPRASAMPATLRVLTPPAYISMMAAAMALSVLL